jgi:hypothetical protein
MKKVALLLVSLAVSTTVSISQAAQVRLDGKGYDVIYDDALVGLFGQPILTGGSLVFNPTTFYALSSSDAWAFTNATLGLSIFADPGYTLASVDLVERGDYLKFGGSATTFVSGQTRAYDFRTPTDETTSAISGADATALSVHDGSTATNWEAKSSQSFAAGTTQAHLTIESLFASHAGLGNLAFVENKYVALTVSAVPEPRESLLLLAGLGLIGGLYRRRQNRIG